MRSVGLCAILLVSACRLSLLAQQPTPAQIPASDAAPAPQDAQPQTPEEQREQQIRQVDPLDRGDDKDAKAKQKTARDTDKTQDQTPTPGSIAASERDARGAGPQVVSEEDAADQPVQDYTGPAVLSRSYSVERPLIPQELKWTESVGVSSNYNTGANGVVNPNGTISSTNLIGTSFNWSFAGRHYFHRDQIAVRYTGGYYQYPGGGGYTGLNNSLSVDYTRFLTRRLSLNLVFSGSIFSQSYTLTNAAPDPETSIANINVSSSPNIQITDYGTKQITTQADFVWQKSARLSFDGGVTYFGIARDNPGSTGEAVGLLGMTGQQARGDTTYRLSRKMTIGAYYSFSHYQFPQSWGTSHLNVVGAIYSYAFTRTMQLRLRAGLSDVDSLSMQVVTVAPVFAALLGQSSGYIDVSSKTISTDISAQFIKDFRRGKTASVSFVHGVSPGNGLYLTSEQESIMASFGMPLFRKFMINGGVGRDTLVAVAQGLSSYESDYVRFSVSRQLERGVSTNFSATLRHFDVGQIIGIRNQLLLTAGVNWGSTNGRLWPF